MPPPAQGPDAIIIRGAREHNLRDVDVRLPRDRLVVITGPSGSGKSSLAFDTLYAEGQRRYVESLSAYARQFLDQLGKPDVESIEGLSPAIAIEQKTVSRSARSTVGTATEVYDSLRLLYARAGTPHCHRCGRPIASQSVGQMTDRVLALPENETVTLLAPVVRGRRGEYKKELESFRSKGFVRVRVDGELLDLADDIPLAKSRRHDIDVVVDRLRVQERARPRLGESITTALGLSGGLVSIVTGSGEEWLLSEANACPDCGVSYPEMAPRLFSFNSPAGACPACDGLGRRQEFDAELLVPDPSLSLAEGAIEPWRGRGRKGAYYRQLESALVTHLGIDADSPWRKLPARARRAILHGLPDNEKLAFSLVRGGKKQALKRRWDGVAGELARRVEEGEAELERYRSAVVCPECEGARLRLEARHVKVGGRSIHELTAWPVEKLGPWIDALELDATRRVVADRILAEIRERLGFLVDVGLGYLSLDRESGTLSGGEGQRIRLATQIGSRLMGVLYILDEPSIGLHTRDHARLIESLLQLRDMGNSVLVVEHDEATMQAADHIVDLGPGAGVHGGAVVAEGPPDAIARHPESPTGAFLSGRRRIAVPAARRRGNGRTLELTGCRENNLKGVDFALPLGVFAVVTGVSGSGKSTLVNDTLHRALAARLHGARERPGRFGRLKGAQHIDKVIDVSQAPIGRTPRSNPATYSGAFDGIRQLLAQVPEARVRGYGPGRFSFNVKGGRCETCKGDGAIRVEMNFLPDLFVGCEVCRGRRYNQETLEITYKGCNIADILEMTVEEALAFFEHSGAVRRPLQSLHDVGLDYITLGQSATTLSGGEAQRIKLARELARRSTGRTLYLLDEPTTGLHFGDVDRLLDVLQKLVDLGNTVVVIEHHLDVVKSADLVVDLGPEGGDRGGEIVASGTPEEVAAQARGHTGRALASVLGAGAGS
ncbi:MAG: excinuclease ABC subunit UvrA [Myxococcota bacterium]